MNHLLVLTCVIIFQITPASASIINESTKSFELDPKFPLISEVDIIRGLSPHGYRGNVRKVHNALAKAIAKMSLQVVIIGGSMPLGAGLEPHSYRDCWPTQLMHMLTSMLGIAVKVHNLGIRAVSSDAQAQLHFNFIMSKVKRDADIIIVDIGFNDKPHHDPEFKERVSYFESAELLSAAAKEASLVRERKKQGEGRLLMQLLLRHAPPTAGIIYYETFVGGGKTSPVIHSLSDLQAALRQGLTDGVYDFQEEPITFDCFPDVGRYYHFQALVEYKIPIFSYPDVVCPIRNESLWGRTMHHSKEHHKFSAYLLARSLRAIARQDTSETQFDDMLPLPAGRIKEWNSYVYNSSSDNKLTLDSKLVDCIVTPLSYVAVNTPLKFVPVRKGTDWRYYMDVAGKPGWIADALPTSKVSTATSSENSTDLVPKREIAFRVTFSALQPMLRLSFLRSYNSSMGTLTCCISKREHRLSRCAAEARLYDFSGHWSDLTSQGVAVSVHLENVYAKNGAHSPPAHVKRNVVCRADGGKFKLIGLVGC